MKSRMLCIYISPLYLTGFFNGFLHRDMQDIYDIDIRSEVATVAGGANEFSSLVNFDLPPLDLDSNFFILKLSLRLSLRLMLINVRWIIHHTIKLLAAWIQLNLENCFISIKLKIKFNSLFSITLMNFFGCGIWHKNNEIKVYDLLLLKVYLAWS